MLRNHSRGALTLILALLLLLPGRTGRADEKVVAEFRRHLERGTALYKAGEYQESLIELQAAYTLRQLPLLLLNIGQAHRKLGHAKVALDFYEFYLRVEPRPLPEIRVELESYIRQTRELLVAAERIKAKEAVEDQARRPGEPPAGTPARVDLRLPALATAPRGAALPLRLAAPRGEGARVPLYRRWWLWTAVGVVAAGAVAGAVAGTYRPALRACPFGEGNDC
jgi:tetratricopeptide (TPR) repeat protein